MSRYPTVPRSRDAMMHIIYTSTLSHRAWISTYYLDRFGFTLEPLERDQWVALPVVRNIDATRDTLIEKLGYPVPPHLRPTVAER